MAFKINHVYSENPYADIVVYYAQVLGIDTVLKMKAVADANETEESLKNYEEYLSCMTNTAIWEIFDGFPEEVLIKSGFTGSALVMAMSNPDNIPESKRKAVLDNMKIYIIDHYEEQNNYYRMLYGLPPLGYENVYMTDDTKIPPEAEIDLSIPVHEMDVEPIIILDNCGALEDMYQEDPENRGYLRYLRKKIHPYSARQASPFYPLYVPTIDSTELSDEYKDRLEINRRYALTALYSQAYKYESDYYDNFIAVFIILNTMIDMISRIQEFIARKEIFDLRTCRYIFESYGVTFFPEIPLKYQIRMVKNLHTLLKYKSTPACMIEICSLFGFENIEIFKYYLLRNRKVTNGGKYSFTGKDYKDFELKFVKIPIDREMDDYIRNPAYYLKYDEVTGGDPTWDGGLDHEYVKRMHQALEFNYTRTKYFSVDSIYELADIAIQQSYFFNMLYDNLEHEDLIKLSVPYITEFPIKLSNLFVFLTALTFRYYKISDNILDTASKVLCVKGFNFHADLAPLADLFEEYNQARMRAGIEPEDLQFTAILQAKDALDRFMIPSGQIPSFNQLMTIFKTNMDVRSILVEGMRNADNKKIYEIYRTLYDSLMTMELTTTHFANPETGDLYRDETGTATYTEYLRNVDPVLYDKLIEIDLMDDMDAKTQYIANLIDNVIYALEEFVDSDDINAFFHGMPAVSADAVKNYIKMVIDFYKSYKVHFLGVNTVYTFDDKWEGWVKIIDDYLLTRLYWKDDFVGIIDQIASQINRMTKADKVAIRERIYMDISTWKYYDLVDRCWIRDDMMTLMKLKHDDAIDFRDSWIRFTVMREASEKIPLLDFFTSFHVTLNPHDHVGIKDTAYISTYEDTGT